MKVTPKQYAKSFLELTAGKTEKQVETLAKAFVAHFAKSGNLKLLRKIIASLEALVAEKEGHLHVTVTVPHADSGALEAFKNVLPKKEGKKVLITSVQDSSLIGGMIVEAGDIRIDASVKHQLSRLREALVVSA